MEEQKRLDEAHGDHWQMVMDPQDFRVRTTTRRCERDPLWQRHQGDAQQHRRGDVPLGLRWRTEGSYMLIQKGKKNYFLVHAV